MANDDSDLLVIGKIVGVHGVKGTVKVLSHAESPDVFRKGGTVFCPEIRESGEISGESLPYEIKWTKPHQRVLLMSLRGINSRTHAEKLIGTEFFLDRAELPEPEEDSYYWADLMGLSVFSADDTYLGRIENIIPTGSNDVYVVKDGDKETLVPALEWVVLSVDLEAKTMRVDLPEGL